MYLSPATKTCPTLELCDLFILKTTALGNGLCNYFPVCLGTVERMLGTTYLEGLKKECIVFELGPGDPRQFSCRKKDGTQNGKLEIGF